MEPNERRKQIGKHLQQLRKGLGFRSAKAFAKSVGINPGTYTSYEQGERSFTYETAWDIADALGCSLDELGGRKWPQGKSRALTGEEASLLDSYRAATPRERYALIATAEAFRDGGLAKNNQVSGKARERGA